MLLQNTAEGQGDGVACTTANSGGWSGDAFNIAGTEGSDAAPLFSSAAAFRGSRGYRIPAGTGVLSRLGWTGLNSTSMAAQFWFRWAGSQTADQRIIAFKNTTTVGGLTLGGATYPNTVMALQGSSALVASRSAALTVGAWYRLEVAILNGLAAAGTYAIRVKDSSLATVHSYSGAFTGPNADAITSVELGRVLTSANYNGTVDLDDWSVLDQATLPDLPALTLFTAGRHITIGG